MTIKEMLDMLLKMSTFEDKINVKVEKELLRPSDVTLQIPDTSKFKKLTGWDPKIPYSQTLRDTLDYWRTNIS